MNLRLRQASKRLVPLVFTHHTLYERYTHFVPFDSEALKRMAIQLATEYCNVVETVIAPSDASRDCCGSAEWKLRYGWCRRASIDSVSAAATGGVPRHRGDRGET